MNDPRWFAHALMTTGMVILWRNPRSIPHLASAATLIMLGGWVKHLLILFPAALTAWILNNNRRAFWQWIGLVGTLGLPFFAAAIAGYSHNFLDGVFHAPRRLNLGRPLLIAPDVLASFFPFLCFALVLARQYRSSEATRFIF